jgi:hypothetical protein
MGRNQGEMMLKTLQHLRWIVVSLAAIVLFHVAIENVAAKKWEIVSQLPMGRSAFSTAVVDEKIYLIGGLLFEHEKGTFGLQPWKSTTRKTTVGSESQICQRLDYMQGQQSWMEKSMLSVAIV